MMRPKGYLTFVLLELGQFVEKVSFSLRGCPESLIIGVYPLSLSIVFWVNRSRWQFQVSLQQSQVERLEFVHTKSNFVISLDSSSVLSAFLLQRTSICRVLEEGILVLNGLVLISLLVLGLHTLHLLILNLSFERHLQCLLQLQH